LGRCPLCGSTEGYKSNLFKTIFQCKSCGAKWKTPSFYFGPISSFPLELIEPSKDGEGKNLLGKSFPLDFWKALYISKEERENVTKRMIKYLPKCPICKSDADYEIRGSNRSLYKYYIECRLCGAAWYSRSWDEEKEEHILYFGQASKEGKGLTLLDQKHSVKFWRKVDIETIETPEDREKERMWIKTKLKELGLNFPSEGEMIGDAIFRIFDPLGALAIRGLPLGSSIISQKIEQFQTEHKARAEKRQKILEKLVLKPECPKCGMEISENFKICPYCGYKLKLMCPSCGREVSPDFKLCPYCGAKLREALS